MESCSTQTTDISLRNVSRIRCCSFGVRKRMYASVNTMKPGIGNNDPRKGEFLRNRSKKRCNGREECISGGDYDTMGKLRRPVMS
ncbi:hypothetical protein JTE90_005012 [Oedothorax gibbosus]|uniref:Uncharacterized protein n=1 Tax=Oedothorax gibbosus TaxID=931172 RepID=A0AAV6VAT6_9ARAC|nr:hypothetical protein JTE90_005012 [Oedothorax gibbosus]